MSLANMYLCMSRVNDRNTRDLLALIDVIDVTKRAYRIKGNLGYFEVAYTSDLDVA